MRKVLVQMIGAFCLLPGLAWAQASPDTERYYGWGPHMMGWGGGWSGMIFGPLFMILSLAALIVLVVISVRWLSGSARDNTAAPITRTPLDILKERFARGEIDKAEFEDGRRVLSE
ncbi:SHOCT domain-containing protein [Bradyrhizobium stylosanthis]|uniref:SHOCT domain-containing protein n=1 Tax=Bradyrhizobium stylosanthis TaxID=1803665 RepID=UPI0007C513D1|nr:SHOCT domain-containing protein [Bradyrhizobium stylosanthis]